MHLDARNLRAIAVGLAILLLYVSRLSKGSAVQTPEGFAFRFKPLFVWSRVLAVPAYLLFFLYMMTVQMQTLPWWMALIFVAAIVLGVVQMPGTITLTPAAITQRFWFRPSKAIQYNEVMAIHVMQGGRTTQVLAGNGVKITHTSNHCAAAEFQQEIERRTSKRLIA
jgi:hypothetical protein